MQGRIVPVVLTCASAVLYGLAFPPTRWTLLVWIALVPFLVALRLSTHRGAIALGWLWSMVGAIVAGTWFPRAVIDYFHQPLAVAILLLAAVSTVMVAPYVIGFALVYRLVSRLQIAALPLVVAAAWAAAELGRGRLLTGTPIFIGNPWGLAGYALIGSPELSQIVSITGVYGLGFVVAAVNSALADVWLRLSNGRFSIRASTVSLGIAFLPLIGAWTYGAWTLQREPETDPGARMTPIAIAQGNVAVGARWDPSRLGQNLDTYLELTRRAVDAGPARIVFWPESAMTYFLEQDPLNHRRLTLELARLDVELLAGAPRIVETPEQRYFNSIYRVLPNGEIAGRYDKEYLVPFAEYFPLDIDLLRRKFGRIRYFDHGTQTAPLDTRAGRAGVIVCNEAMLPEVVGQRVADGAEYLFNPSNDTWISDPQYTEQQLDIARARAIEQRRTLVRASTAGPSAIIDPTGRVVAMTEPLRADYLLGEIGSSTGRSIYGRVGDLFALLCLAVTAGAAAYAHRVRPEERRAVSPRVPQ